MSREGVEERMSGRIGGGVAGWIAGVLPLLAVNVADYVGFFTFDEAVVAGTAALVAGIVLGGGVAGYIGGRTRPGRPGGAVAAAPAGMLAALLFALSEGALLVGTSIRTSAVDFSALEWIRRGLTVIFFAALLLGIALLAGAVSGRRSATRTAAFTATPPMGSASYSRANAAASRPNPARPGARYSQPGGSRAQPGDERWEGGAGWHEDQPYAHRPDDRYPPSQRPDDDYAPMPARTYGQSSRPTRRPSGPSGPRGPR
jgi:hypothetical protein